MSWEKIYPDIKNDDDMGSVSFEIKETLIKSTVQSTHK